MPKNCDVTGVSCLDDETGSIVVHLDEIIGMWQRYMETCWMWKYAFSIVDSEAVEGPAEVQYTP